MLIVTILSFIYIDNTLQGSTVYIYIDGKFIGEYNMKVDQTIDLDGILGPSKIKIKDESVQMILSPCPHQICVNMGRISKANRSIVCVPNRILIQLQGEDKDHLDAITQ